MSMTLRELKPRTYSYTGINVTAEYRGKRYLLTHCNDWFQLSALLVITKPCFLMRAISQAINMIQRILMARQRIFASITKEKPSYDPNAKTSKPSLSKNEK